MFWGGLAALTALEWASWILVVVVLVLGAIVAWKLGKRRWTK